MASKVQIQKAHQGYVGKPSDRACRSCEHFRTDIVQVEPGWMQRPYQVEKNLRCGIGGFAVKKTAVCNLYVPKGEA